jgi:FkbM family methyltransferase
MNILDRLNRPEYIFRPTQIYKRLSRSKNKQTNQFENVSLPWDVDITIRPNEVIGRSIWIMGIYDLSVTEVLWRLIDLGESAVDVGANIGYLASLMAHRVGDQGKVYCFEPHPEIYQELSHNCEQWRQASRLQSIEVYQIALSNQSGEGTLITSDYFKHNRGTATLAATLSTNKPKTVEAAKHKVTISTLDEIIPKKEFIGVLKIDVEGHELEVLRGAKQLISEDKIRDIIFEDNRRYPTDVSQFLIDKDYTIFKIIKGFRKPLLLSLSDNHQIQSWESQSYLATKDVNRAKNRLSGQGWYSLSK